MKYPLLIFVISFLLAACANVANFNKTEYEHVVNIGYRISDVPSFCASQDSMKAGVVQLQREIDWTVIYAGGFSGNDQISIMLNGLKDQTDRFAKIINATKPPSRIYCFEKLNNLNAVVSILIKSEASKPR